MAEISNQVRLQPADLKNEGKRQDREDENLGRKVRGLRRVAETFLRIGFQNAEEFLLKAKLETKIAQLIEEERLNQTQAA